VRGKTGRGTPARGAPAKPRVGAGTTPAAIRSGLGRATSYVKSQAKLNFTAFKGKKS
jgi:hypothetical protein